MIRTRRHWPDSGAARRCAVVLPTLALIAVLFGRRPHVALRGLIALLTATALLFVIAPATWAPQ